MKRIVAAACVVAAGAVAWLLLGQTRPDAQTATADSPTAPVNGAPIVEVVLPDALSDEARIGKTIFEAKCAACHGANAAGQQGVAPPLVHVIYEPSHHGDESFQIAAARGVRAHHWPFGNMPPVEGVTRADVATVIAYIRELQRANGIR